MHHEVIWIPSSARTLPDCSHEKSENGRSQWTEHLESHWHWNAVLQAHHVPSEWKTGMASLQAPDWSLSFLMTFCFSSRCKITTDMWLWLSMCLLWIPSTSAHRMTWLIPCSDCSILALSSCKCHCMRGYSVLRFLWSCLNSYVISIWSLPGGCSFHLEQFHATRAGTASWIGPVLYAHHAWMYPHTFLILK